MRAFRGLLALLLRHEGYPPAVIVALLLHGTMVLFLLERDLGRTEFVNVERPPYINATVMQENPQRLRRTEELERQRQAAASAERQRQQEAERQRQQEAERRRVEQEQQAARQRETQARADEERRQRELAEQRERERQQDAERQRQEQLAREQAAREQAAREQAAREQAARQAEAAAASASAVASYTAIIHDAVSQNWLIPPSARNGMTAVVRIQLVPTGEVVDVRVIQSSGDPAFDRSVEQAVRKAARFPELQGMDIALFERDFRTIFLQFRPEDLLR